MEKLIFNQNEKTVIEAKRLASIHYNKKKTKSVEEFSYQTDNGTYYFTRINTISPNGEIKFGKWK